ncbi:peptidase C2 calpain, partial [Streptomyces sp. NPDC096040]
LHCVRPARTGMSPPRTGQHGTPDETRSCNGPCLAGLKKAFDSGKVVTVSTPDDENLDKDHPKEWGNTYCTDHAYYVRGFTADGKVILGNPWGVSGYPPITVSQEQFDKYFGGAEAFDAP